MSVWEEQRNPLEVAKAFVHLAMKGASTPGVLGHLVTPEINWERVDDWGAELESVVLGGGGLLARVRRAELASDVAYAIVVHDAAAAVSLDPTEGGTPVQAHVITLVWRPELESWLVHSVGEYVHPDEVPRTSHGVAPASPAD